MKPRPPFAPNAKSQPKYPPLEPVYGSSYCQYTVIENKLETLYKNQEKIYTLLIQIAERIQSL